MALASEKCRTCMVNTPEYKFLASGRNFLPGYNRKYMRIFDRTCGLSYGGSRVGGKDEMAKDSSCKKFSKPTFSGKNFWRFFLMVKGLIFLRNSTLIIRQ